MELLIGCGSNRIKKLARPDRKEWSGLVTMDFNADHGPDIVHDIAQIPLPMDDNSCDEIHAYDVLEHVGRQGDWRFFFDQWSDFYRILKPGGVFYGISPHWSSPWCWMDPGHTRAMGPEAFIFLSQPSYSQIGKSPMTDYRFAYSGDFDLIHNTIDESKQFYFALQAVKPARINHAR